MKFKDLFYNDGGYMEVNLQEGTFFISEPEAQQDEREVTASLQDLKNVLKEGHDESFSTNVLLDQHYPSRNDSKLITVFTGDNETPVSVVLSPTQLDVLQDILGII